MNINFSKAQVILDKYGPDIVLLWTDLPSSMPKVTKQNLSFKIEVEAGKGVEYVREHFHIEPEVIGYPNASQD